MSLRHNKFDLCGVQFHPESVMTPEGRRMMRNWLKS
jgi:anthranilate synthase component 2